MCAGAGCWDTAQAKGKWKVCGWKRCCGCSMCYTKDNRYKSRREHGCWIAENDAKTRRDRDAVRAHACLKDQKACEDWSIPPKCYQLNWHAISTVLNSGKSWLQGVLRKAGHGTHHAMTLPGLNSICEAARKKVGFKLSKGYESIARWNRHSSRCGPSQAAGAWSDHWKRTIGLKPEQSGNIDFFTIGNRHNYWQSVKKNPELCTKAAMQVLICDEKPAGKTAANWKVIGRVIYDRRGGESFATDNNNGCGTDKRKYITHAQIDEQFRQMISELRFRLSAQLAGHARTIDELGKIGIVRHHLLKARECCN